MRQCDQCAGGDAADAVEFLYITLFQRIFAAKWECGVHRDILMVPAVADDHRVNAVERRRPHRVPDVAQLFAFHDEAVQSAQQTRRRGVVDRNVVITAAVNEIESDGGRGVAVGDFFAVGDRFGDSAGGEFIDDREVVVQLLLRYAGRRRKSDDRRDQHGRRLSHITSLLRTARRPN